MPRKVFFKRACFVLRHVYGAENELRARGYGVRIGGVKHRHAGKFFGHRDRHFPALADCLTIAFARRAAGRRKARDFKVRVILKQSEKTLTHHTGGADHTTG